VLLPYKEKMHFALFDKRLDISAAGLARLPFELESGSKVGHFGTMSVLART